MYQAAKVFLIRTKRSIVQNYWHEDNLRLYGIDYRDRLEQAVFLVKNRAIYSATKSRTNQKVWFAD